MDLTQIPRTADDIDVGIETDFVRHSGSLLDDATIQVSHIEDLVTPVDPTNEYSFLSHLNNHKRFYLARIGQEG